jgi:hypothetical protein
MRTLFLLGIMVALVAIASKRSDQTAWDAVRDLGGKAKTIISEVQEPAQKLMPSIPLPETLPSLSLPGDTSTGTHADGAKTSGLSRKSDNAPAPDEIRADDRPVKPDLGGLPHLDDGPLEDTPESAWPELPEIPVASHPIQSPKAPTLEASNTRVTSPGADYADVKIFYENASRLLEEIK